MNQLTQKRAASACGVETICAGDPYEMGVAQGIGLRDKVRDARAALARLEAFRLEQPRWLPYRVYRRVAERKATRLLSGALTADYPAMSRRLAGIAHGSGLRLDSVYLFNALEPLLSSVAGRTVVPGPGACSTVAVTARRTGIGEPIVAKNFDYVPLVQPFYTLRDSRPAQGLRSLDFTVAPLAGAVDGLNEHGLCITYNYAFTVDAATPSGTISMSIAEALARCSTVAEAAAHIASRPRWGGGLLMLADASGDLASLELSSTRWRLRRLAPGEELMFHTNAFTCAEMREVEVDKRAVFTDRAPVALRGRRVQQSAEERDCRLSELLRSSTTLGPDELAQLMADHGPEGIPNDYTVCVHGSYWSTTAALQYFPRSRRLRVDYAAACQARYEEVSL
jgi:hypothetical protein